MCLDSRADKTFPIKQGRHDANFPNLPTLAQSGYVSGHEGEERSSLGCFEAPIQMRGCGFGHRLKNGYWGNNAIETGGAVALFESGMRVSGNGDGLRYREGIGEHAAVLLRILNEKDL
jgi:hypothetical protein